MYIDTYNGCSDIQTYRDEYVYKQVYVQIHRCIYTDVDIDTDAGLDMLRI